MSRMKPAQLASSFYRITGSFTGNLTGTASWASNAVTASYITGSGVYGPYGSNSVISASYAVTSSQAISALQAVSASYALSASYEINYETSSSYAETASFATTASYALNAGIDTGSLVSTASFNAFTASYATGSFTGSFAGDGSGLTGVILPLSSSYIFVGNASNVATGVPVTGAILIDNTGFTTYESHSLTYDKIQYVSQPAILGSTTASGQVSEIPFVPAYLTSSIPTTLLDDTNNWDINGNYTGTAISGTYQGQSHYNANYWYTAVNDNIWIRLIRG